MIRKLKAKMIAIILCIMIFVFAAVLVSLNVFVRSSDEKNTTEMLEQIAEQDGFFQEEQNSNPDQRPGDTPHFMRFDKIFYVKLDAQGNVIDANTDRMFYLTQETALAYAQTVYRQGVGQGTIDNLQYLAADKDYGTIIVFAEKSAEAQLLGRLMQSSLWVAGASCLILLALAMVLSNWAIKPVKDSFDRQRRFISDASHELKTPLTIISANADLLESEIGDNNWLSGIQVQTRRMSALVNDLLMLARSDEQADQVNMRSFDLSRVVASAALEFESRAYEEQKELDIEVQQDVTYVGDPDRIRQLAMLLLDNALTHSDSGGRVAVRLGRESGKIRFSVANSGGGIDPADKDLIFERFYRSDHSRSRQTGGYGLGLAIAKSIVDVHKGKIAVDVDTAGWVEFIVRL